MPRKGFGISNRPNYRVAEFEEKFNKLKAELGLLDLDSIQNYMDWGKTVVYKLELGDGECTLTIT
tara:strand:- start:216 stop:410 length:195 start_codon:yes stop_codon:yes gene_type:complete